MFSNRYAAVCAAACLAGLIAGPSAWAQATQAGDLTLQQAFARALGDDPGLKATSAAVRAADASVRQADRRPNPTLEATTENFGGSGHYGWLDRSETTFAFSQTLELGGDRQARTRLAERDAKAARLGGDASRQDLLFAIELAFFDAQRTRVELDVARTRLALAEKIVVTVERRVQAARDPLLAGARSKTSLVDAEINAERARLAHAAAVASLATFWGGSADFTIETETFVSLGEPPGEGELAASPDLERSIALQERADAAIDVERARSKLDPTISAGVRLFNDVDEAAFVVGVSIPLAIWDNNSAAMERAAAERQRARYETEALRRNLERETATARAQIDIARSEIEALDARLLPSAEEALARAQDGYAQGGFSYLDVLEAQRVLGDARLQRISALHAYHRARATFVRLTGAYADAAPAQELSQ